MMLHFLLACFPSLSFRHHPQHISITTIPQEIVALLLTYLSTPDQISLALTCKSFYNYYVRSFLQTQGITVDLSRLIPAKRKEKRLYRNMNIQNEPWIQLLKQLENKRWKFCSECWRLHQSSAWRHPRHSRFSFDGALLVSDSKNPMMEESSCMPYAGTQDICPCLEITYPDKIRLIEKLQSVRNRDGMTTREYYHDRILYHPVPRLSPKYIGHQCDLMSQHPLAHVNAYTIIDWDEDEDRLRVQTQYKFSDSTHFKGLLQSLNSSSSSNESSPPEAKQWVPPPGIQTPYMCPHKKSRTWLKQFFKESKMEFSGLSSSIYTLVLAYNRKCNCDKTMNQFQSYDDLSIYVKRDLGGIKWLGKSCRRDLEGFLDAISINEPVVFPVSS